MGDAERWDPRLPAPPGAEAARIAADIDAFPSEGTVSLHKSDVRALLAEAARLREAAPVYGDRVRVECPRCDALGTTVDQATGLGVVCACGGSGVILARYVPLAPPPGEPTEDGAS